MRSYIGIILFVFLFSVDGMAAEIRMAPKNDYVDTSKTVVISGVIESGDTDKLLNNIILNPNPDMSRYPVSEILLGPSAGGNLEEALNIAFLVRTLRLKVIVLDRCYSACAIIALASPFRVYAGELGLHRPYFDSDFYGNKSSEYIESWHSKMNERVKGFMSESYVSSAVVDKMMSTSSRDMWVVSASDAPEVFSNFHPYFEETIYAKCSDLPVTIPDLGINAECLDENVKVLQKHSLIRFLKAVSQGDFQH